jgi:hypothetical protein
MEASSKGISMTTPYGRTRNPSELLRRQQEREAAAAEVQRQEAERAQAQTEARERIKARAAAKRLASATQAEIAREQLLQPEKIRLQREWLANHPDKNEDDFTRYAWPQLRANVESAQEARTLEQAKADLATRRPYPKL